MIICCNWCNRDITDPKDHYVDGCKYNKKHGYHISSIEKGALGEASKVKEECQEFMDAVNQKVPIMALLELSDMVGAIEAYLVKYHKSISLHDLKAMSVVTKRAFDNGHRD